MKTGWLSVMVAFAIGACDDEPKASPDPSEDKSDELAAAKATCKTYCDKQEKCFPGALPTKGSDRELWAINCASDCLRDIEATPVAAFIRGIATCNDKACGDELGSCIAERVAKTLERDDAGYLGLPPVCVMSHACQLAGSYGTARETTRAKKRSVALEQQAKLYRGLHDGTPADAATACKLLVGDERCAGSKTPAGTAAIELSCDDYCDKLVACYPKSTSGSGWKANCRDGCNQEAKAGSSHAAFFAAVAHCKDAACGGALGTCVAERVAKHWPETPSGWDMPGLDPACMLLRACTEVRFFDAKPGDAKTLRDATYGSYRKIFEQLGDDRAATKKQCNTMASYSPCE
jgi:hypothetical protein